MRQVQKMTEYKYVLLFRQYRFLLLSSPVLSEIDGGCGLFSPKHEYVLFASIYRQFVKLTTCLKTYSIIFVAFFLPSLQ